ncbi:MAG: PEP-CTERM sorting domain-containing protein [Verrucomicrobiota bacterium JB022]|nr:PEP-CTERM sorting domain-containing protein [Verrucomicrobiota bacterium JB022]
MSHAQLILAAAAAITALPTAHAAVYVAFSGGNGSPLSITLPAIEWELPDASGMNAYSSVFGIGIQMGQTPSMARADASTGGDSADWSSNNEEISFSPVDANFYVNNNFDPLNAGGIIWFGMSFTGSFADGDTVNFAGGTISNTSSVAQSFADGNYEVYLISGLSGAVVSGTAAPTSPVVPEPSTYAAVAGLGVLGFVALRRRSR